MGFRWGTSFIFPSLAIELRKTVGISRMLGGRRRGILYPLNWDLTSGLDFLAFRRTP